MNKKCAFSNTPAEYQIGVALYNKRTPENMVGFVSAACVEEGINNVIRQCFGTNMWPTVHDLEGNLLYHSYDAERKKIAAAAGWKLQNQAS